MTVDSRPSGRRTFTGGPHVRHAIAVVGTLAFVLGARATFAAEVTRVAAGVEPGRRWPELTFALSWMHEEQRSAIKREQQSSTSRTTELVRDLLHRRSRDLLNLRIESGTVRGISVHIDLPFVVRDDRELAFDQREGSTCLFPGESPLPTCVNEQSATVLRDGILPADPGGATYGIDARHEGARFSRPSPTVFRGPRRKGLEAFGVGVSWAAFDQRRDPSKPTWRLGLDGRFAAGSTMRFDPANPAGNTAVGLGYHELIAATFVSKRFSAIEPYFGVYFVQPVVGDGSPFAGKAPNQPYAGPQRRVGAQIGFEHLAWQGPDPHQRVILEVRGRAEQLFQGRSRSELWEVLSGASRCAVNVADCRAGLDVDGAGRPAPYSGISETQAFGRAGADIGLHVHAGRHARFRGLFGYATEMPHFITFATEGTDANRDGRVNPTDGAEANPVYRPLIDAPGRRFKADGTQIWTVLLEGMLTF